MQIQFFDSINVEIPYEKIYRRLGYRQGITKVAAQEKKETKNLIDNVFALLTLKAAALRVSVSVSERQVILANGYTFNSKLLANLLKGAKEMLCLAATGGSKIIQAIHNLEKDDLKLAVIYDASASEIVDAAFDWLKSYIEQTLSRENLYLLNKRISCGYSDFSIKYQKVFYELLQLKELGITINEAYMLIPEKSATAVMAITKKGSE
jgi:hypothetical protein